MIQLLLFVVLIQFVNADKHYCGPVTENKNKEKEFLLFRDYDPELCYEEGDKHFKLLITTDEATQAKTYALQYYSDGECAKVTLGEYAAQVVDLQNISADKVAIVYAEGQIVDGEGTGEMIYGNSLAEKIRTVREDDQVKAVVLRVNSPGGSALASDVIWREMELLKSEKPIIVSMGSYAASGGYYISAPADVIVADKMTLTGSIGVFGMFLNPIDALKNKHEWSKK